MRTSPPMMPAGRAPASTMTPTRRSNRFSSCSATTSSIPPPAMSTMSKSSTAKRSANWPTSAKKTVAEGFVPSYECAAWRRGLHAGYFNAMHDIDQRSTRNVTKGPIVPRFMWTVLGFSEHNSIALKVIVHPIRHIWVAVPHKEWEACFGVGLPHLKPRVECHRRWDWRNTLIGEKVRSGKQDSGIGSADMSADAARFPVRYFDAIRIDRADMNV
jgi:hypothetical protein